MDDRGFGPETIVDGNNLMYTIDETRRLAIKSVARGRAKLSAMIGEYAQKKGLRITVVYDGHASETSYEKQEGPLLRILLSEAPETADERILKLLRGDPDPSRLTIVTSDLKDIGNLAKSYGAKLVTSGRFGDQIGGTRSHSRRGWGPGRAPRDSRPKVDEKKIEKWLELIRKQQRE